ncbi:MAG: TetR/AcrR family transcriptional regulator, partial [Methanobacterium sp.]
MDTALKMFAERSYLGAKTKSIAEEAGFSEMTLFRKFKTKKNLYD